MNVSHWHNTLSWPLHSVTDSLTKINTNDFNAETYNSWKLFHKLTLLYDNSLHLYNNLCCLWCSECGTFYLDTSESVTHTWSVLRSCSSSPWALKGFMFMNHIKALASYLYHLYKAFQSSRLQTLIMILEGLYSLFNSCWLFISGECWF